ncbi:MAG TPA: ATP-binding protein [Tepidisphaeraceae bacterium]|jgi:hypothetical protein|nr:ATP-binding protein [Tepidisphaeraceae bacterium]
MALSLASISKGRALKAPRIVLLGVEKIGKSTFAGGAENPVFIPIKGEEGIDDLDVAKFPTARSYADVLEAIRVLYQEEHDHKTVVIDSASTLERLVWEQTCANAGVPSIERVGGGFGKGYVEALKLWQELMDGLDALREERGMATIIIGHVKVKVFNDPLADPYDTYLFDVQEKASNALFRWADSILFANVKTIVNKQDAGFNKKASRATSTNERKIYTQKRPAHPGGGRGAYGQLPYEIPMNWQEFMAEVTKASQAAPAA